MRFIRKPVDTHRFILFVTLNLMIVLACLPFPAPTTNSTTNLTPAPPGPFTLPTPTPLPPTPTPTPTQSTTPGAVVQSMTVRHEKLSTEQIDPLLASFLPGSNWMPAEYAVDTYRIWFQTRDENDLAISVQADLRFPRVEITSTFPILVYGSGTTGIANRCAALNEQFVGRRWGSYRSHMLSYAAQGYMAILPNWQGFDDRDRVHPYFVAELEGRVMLDAARAVYDFFAHPPAQDILARPAQAVFLGGYSQGGHGAFAADRLAPDYAPELEIKGIIGHAMAPDVEGLMRDSPLYGPYIVYAYRAFYGADLIDPADVFVERWLSTFESDVTSKCIDEVLAYYPDNPALIYTPEFRNALYNDRLAEMFPAFKEKLDANDSNQKNYTSVPALILYGQADPIVKVSTIAEFVSYLCARGKNVTSKRYAGIDHFQARQYSFKDTLAWMQNILDGNTPVPNCSDVPTPRGENVTQRRRDGERRRGEERMVSIRLRMVSIFGAMHLP